MQTLSRLSKLLIIGLLMISPMCVHAQVPNPNADAVYDGFVNSYLISSGDGTKTPYFCQTLKNRSRAFFWQQAYLITACEDAYDRAPSATRKQFINDLLTKLLAQDLLNWTWDSWNDDMQWAIIACIRGYQITGVTAFRDAAVNNWNWCYNRGWDSTYGGGIWEDNNQIPNGGKCGLSNWPEIIPGCMIYESLLATNPTMANDILTKCKNIYTWGRTHLWDPATGRVYEGYYPDASRNFTGDDNSYNYGLLTNAAASLYKITQDVSYLNDAVIVADKNIAKINSKTAGIMTEDKYWNGGFGCEQFVRGLAKLANENYMWNKYWQFLSNNCTAAWNHRIPNYNFTRNDFSKQSTYVDSIMAMELTGCVSIQQVTPVLQSIPNTIEAENYNYMSGIQTETTTDTGGGKDVGYIEVGDWMDYIINVPTTGVYTIYYRVAGTVAGSIAFKQNGQTVTTTNLPNTGGFQTWTTVRTTLSLTAGIQSIRLQSISGNWNINWWRAVSGDDCPPTAISPNLNVNNAGWQQTATATMALGGTIILGPQPTTGGTWSWSGPNGFTATTREVTISNIQANQCGNYTATYTNACGVNSTQVFTVASLWSSLIEAESYTSMSGVQTETCSEGGLDVTSIGTGDYMNYNVSAPTTGSYKLYYRVASTVTGGILQLEQTGGGATYGTVSIPNTGGLQTWQTVSHTVNLTAGVKLSLKANVGGFNLNWWGTNAPKLTPKIATDVADLNSTGISIYPNPATDFIKIMGVQANTEIVVSNLVGQVLLRVKSTNESGVIELNISNLTSGTYMVKIGNEKTFKLLKR